MKDHLEDRDMLKQHTTRKIETTFEKCAACPYLWTEPYGIGASECAECAEKWKEQHHG